MLSQVVIELDAVQPLQPTEVWHDDVARAPHGGSNIAHYLARELIRDFNSFARNEHRLATAAASDQCAKGRLVSGHHSLASVIEP